MEVNYATELGAANRKQRAGTRIPQLRSSLALCIAQCAMCLESPLKIVPSDPLTRGRADIVEMLGFGEDEGSIENGPNQQQ